MKAKKEQQQPIRPERIYSVTMEDESGGEDTIEFAVPEGTEQEQDEAADRCARAATEQWIERGEYGDDGASVVAWYSLADDEADYEWPRRRIIVDIAPDHRTLIQAARGHHAADDACCGDDPEDHDWTSEGEGGCDENPGVWTTGGTSFAFRSHCRRCGLIRCETAPGSQRNPGEHDTVMYEMPEYWCADHQSDDPKHEHEPA